MNSILKNVFNKSLLARLYSSRADVPIKVTLPYLKESEELSYNTFSGGSKFYIVNFKRGPDGAKFLKFSERSHGRRCNIFFGLGEDLNKFVDALKQAPNAKPEEIVSVWSSSSIKDTSTNIQRVNDFQILITQEVTDATGKFKKIHLDRKLCDLVSQQIIEQKNKLEKD